MNDDRGFHDLEQRLRREADAVSARHACLGSAAGIRTEFRRRRARRLRRGGMAAALLVICGWAGYAIWTHPGGGALEQDRIATALPDPSSPSPGEAVVQGPAMTAVAERPPTPAEGSAAPAPFLITVADKAEPKVIAVGVYIPPRVERINLRDLPPLEQAAVRRVLGLDEPAEKPTI
jgi:hypothetical protein